MKESIKSFLAKSKTIEKAYMTSRKIYAQQYRRFNNRDLSSEYKEIVTPQQSLFDHRTSDYGCFENEINVVPHPDVNNPVLTRDDITDAVARFVADPFVVYNDGIYDMFFEIKDDAGEVYIGHAFSENGLHYKYNQIIIKPEEAHHTYPYVFRYNGEWVMAPSPGPNVKGEFRIYVAKNYPTDWELLATPIKKRVRQDPTPILWDNTWYLIYQDTDNLNVILKYTDSLVDSNWREHPESPLFVNDPETTRKAEMVPSGRPVYNKNHVNMFYRSHEKYELYHYRITKLSPESFVQKKVSETPVFANRMKEEWNERFMHTVNPVYPWSGTKNIVAVDGLERDNYVYSIGIYTIH